MRLTVIIERQGVPYWTRLIQELQNAGVTLDEIAAEIGISLRMVCYLKATSCDPRHSVGEKLKELHARKVPHETVQSPS
ncbi:MAG TPA: hypothetical protein VFU31_24945 [Candidatus Binatia bacterium]|nr:hypothetical protein [Candidatus Binatia bacterium]